ncbi:MAG: HupE/UreJ family protein [Gemmatimonadetes bacterium]|nr:HupE/UreJ family protein [Gemmatimonadota bacterium]
MSRLRLWSRVLLLATLALSVPTVRATAHEVPRHVAVRTWVAPEPTRIRMLVQIPVDAIRDVEWPRRRSARGDSVYLDVARVQPFLEDAARLWVADGVALRDGDRLLPALTVRGVRAVLPGDRAFDGFASALAGIASAPLDSAVAIVPGQLRLEVLLELPLTAPVRDLVIEPRWAHLGITTASTAILRLPDGTERAYSWTGDPGALRLDPRWWHAATRFVGDGMGHLFGGIDHLLFLLCLVLPVRRLRPLIGIVTAFTVAHSLTLFASALGYAPTAGWFVPLVELLIAVSIILMALGNVLGVGLERRWLVAFVFGLVHGFGFSAALGDGLQFAGGHLLVALAAFNIGLELAQVVVLLAAVPLLNALFARAIPERGGIIVASALVAHEAWHWMLERAQALEGQRVEVPRFDAAFASTLLGWAMAAVALVGVGWLVQGLVQRLDGRTTRRATVALLAGLLAVGGLTLAPRAAQAQAPTRTTMAGVYTPDQAQKGREVFIATCLGCHTTASHTGPAFALKWFGRPLADLFDYVSNMMPKTAPASLSEDEYVWLMAYILRLNGMPAGKAELSAEPKLLKSVRIDSTTRAGTDRSPAGLEDSSPGPRPTPRQ